MLLLSLDEKGDFEQSFKKNEPVLIAGVMYDDCKDGLDLNYERIRLVNYFQKVCASVGKNYPEDMHAGNQTTDADVRAVKLALKRSLPEYVQKGTFEGEELVSLLGNPISRTGRYHFFAMLKSKDGKQELIGTKVNDLIRDDFAGNLYVHMAEDVISRCMFHNPVIEEIEEVSFDLATRRIVLTGTDKNARAQEYIRLRYPEVVPAKRTRTDSREFILTNPDVYRTAIEREMMVSDRSSIKIDKFTTRSINYHYGSANEMAFLQLADVTCSLIGHRLNGDSPGQWIEEIDKRLNEITGTEDNLVFAYDVVDTYFQEAWKRIEEADYYKALSIAYDGIHCGSECAEFYRRKWFPRLERKLAKVNDCSSYTLALHKFKESSLNNNLNQDKMSYILNGLESMEENIEFPSIEDMSVLYKLYDTAAAVLNHNGQSELAEAYLKKGEQFFRYIGVEEMLRSRNKEVVALCDQFNFRRAMEVATENLEQLELIHCVRSRMTGEKSGGWYGLGRALSQLGQVYGFLRSDKAEEIFLRALNEFEPKTPNYMITLSYLLHVYLDRWEKEKYEKMMADYLVGSADKEAQLIYLVREGSKAKNPIISLKFAMYVYIKGLYVFGKEEMSQALLDKLLMIEKTCQEIDPAAVRQINGHPWQLIYKYLAFIAHEAGQKEISLQYMQKAGSILRTEDGILRAIVEFGNAEYADLIGNVEAREDHAQRAWNEIYSISEELTRTYDTDQNGTMYDRVSGLMTYIYR